MKKIYFIAIIFLLSSSCAYQKRNSEMMFINKYKNDDFSDFVRTKFIVRGLDRNNNFIVFKYDTTSCGFLRIILDKDDLDLLELRAINQRNEPCLIDTSFSNYLLSKRFLSYDINLLEVDANENVYIRLRNDKGKHNIFKASDITSVPNFHEDQWNMVVDNWYIRIKE